MVIMRLAGILVTSVAIVSRRGVLARPNQARHRWSTKSWKVNDAVGTHEEALR